MDVNNSGAILNVLADGVCHLFGQCGFPISRNQLHITCQHTMSIHHCGDAFAGHHAEVIGLGQLFLLRLLIATDNGTTQRMLRHLLSGRGISIQFVSR